MGSCCRNYVRRFWSKIGGLKIEVVLYIVQRRIASNELEGTRYEISCKGVQHEPCLRQPNLKTPDYLRQLFKSLLVDFVSLKVNMCGQMEFLSWEEVTQRLLEFEKTFRFAG